MTTVARELVAGAVASVGLLALFLLGMMPSWLAILLAAGVYVGLRCSIPATPLPHELIHEGGVTEAELRELVDGGRRHLREMQRLHRRITRLQPDFSPALQALCQVTEALLTHFEQEPKSVRLAGLLPVYLEKIVANLQRYVELAPQGGIDVNRQRLAVTEEMVQSAITAFTHLQQQLYRDDWLSLEAEAETLKTLFESDLQ